MQKRLAILGLLLFAAWTLAGLSEPTHLPESGITAQSTGKTGSQQASPQHGKTDRPQTVPVNVQIASTAEQREAATQQENLDIQRKLEWFTGILAIVGVLQVLTMIWQAGLLRGTMKEIHAQAWHMERQTKILEASVSAAQKSADAAFAQIEMIKSKERAQFRIEFADLDLALDEKLGGYPIHFKVIMDGTTRAYILEEDIIADIPGLPWEKIRCWSLMGLPRDTAVRLKVKQIQLVAGVI